MQIYDDDDDVEVAVPFGIHGSLHIWNGSVIPYVEVVFSFRIYWLLLHIEVACAFKRRDPLSKWVLTPKQLNLLRVFNIELCLPSLPCLSDINLVV